MSYIDPRNKKMGSDDPIEKEDQYESIVKQSQQWVENFYDKNFAGVYPWSEQKAREFSQISIETLVKDDYFLGMRDTVYDGVMEDIEALFREREKRDIHLAVFQEGIGCVNPKKSWIWTPLGLQLFEDIIKNKDKRILSKNGLQYVLGYKKEKKKTYLLRTRTGREIECGEDHPFFIMPKTGVPQFIQCKNINISEDYIGIKLGDNQFGPKSIPLDLAWTLGALIGDGCVTQHVQMTAHKDDVDILYEVKMVLEKYFNCFCKIYQDNRSPDCYRLVVNQKKELVNFLISEEVFGHNAFTKSIPKSILSGTKDVWTAFLSGYFDTDGHSDKNGNIRISSVSKELISQVQYALSNLGILSILGKKKTSWNNGLKKSFTWRLKINGPYAKKFYDEIGFRLKRKDKNKEFLKDTNNPNINIIPNQASILYSVWKTSNKIQKGFKTIINSNYEQFPSKEKLIRFYENYNGSSDRVGLELIKERIDENIFWDSIEEIRLLDEEKELMDIVVDVENNYITNSIISHNSGKTLKASVLIWLSWFKLSTLGMDPQKYYGLAPRSVIALMSFSRSESQSRHVTFTEVFNRFQTPFNHDYFPVSDKYTREIRIENNNTCIFPGTSSALSALGYNLYGGIIDEAAFLENIEDSKKAVDGDYDAAEQMYYAIYNRMVSRFLKAGKLPGLICMISSPQLPNDFMSRKIDEAIRLGDESGIFWRRRSTWEAKGKKHYPEFPKDSFYIDTENTELLEDPNLVAMLDSIDPKKFPLNVDMEAIQKISKYFKK